MKNSISHVVIIPADINHVACAVAQLLSFLQNQTEVDDDNLFDTKVILNELIVNAIVHGNKEDSDKKVTAKMYISNHRIIIIVEDQGKGINVSEFLEDRSKCNVEHYNEDNFLFDENGRGLKLVSSLCKCIRFNKSGNRVVILKEIDRLH